MTGKDAGACAETHQQLASVDNERFLKRTHECLAGILNLGDTRGAFIHHREFIATEACGESRCADRAQQALCDRLQDAIAEIMTHAVIDVLEMVQVQEQHAHEFIARAGDAQRPVQMGDKLAAIRQPGQRIVLREVQQLARAPLNLGFELAVVFTCERLCRRQLSGHMVE
jgi:hypothetical protein